jgi:hypothetical protein
VSEHNKQRYALWKPVEKIPARLYCEAIHDDAEGLRILLRESDPHGPVLSLRFESVIGYRNVNESYRLRTWLELGNEEVPPLLIVRDSQWIEWLRNEGGETIDWSAVVHYAIFTPEDCIDIATEFPPTVRWL